MVGGRHYCCWVGWLVGRSKRNVTGNKIGAGTRCKRNADAVDSIKYVMLCCAMVLCQTIGSVEPGSRSWFWRSRGGAGVVESDSWDETGPEHVCSRRSMRSQMAKISHRLLSTIHRLVGKWTVKCDWSSYPATSCNGRLSRAEYTYVYRRDVVAV